VTSRANPENEPKTTTHHRKSEHGGAGKQIKAVDLASIRAANTMLTGKGWCGRKNSEHHRCIIYIMYETIWILEKRK
jgi:hypothetical protein